MSDHRVTPEAQALLDHWGKSGSLGHLARTANAGGGVSSGGAPGSTMAAGKLQVRMFADKSTTSRWMDKFDEFNAKKAQAVEINGRRYTREEFLDGFVYPVGTQLRRAIDILAKLNADSATEARGLSGQARDEVNAEVTASGKHLDQAGGHLNAGHYGPAYNSFIHGLNQAMVARATIGQASQKTIDDADHMVTACELTRDAGFMILNAAMPERAVLIMIAGAVVKGADDWAGGKDFKQVGLEFVVGMLIHHANEKVAAAIVKAWGPLLEGWLDRAFGGMIQGVIANSPLLRKFNNWAMTQEQKELRQACIKLMSGHGLSPQEAKPVLDGVRRYIADENLVKLMLKTATERASDVLKALGSACYAQMVASGPGLPFKESSLHLLEETRKEMGKDSKARSDLFWSLLHDVANAL